MKNTATMFEEYPDVVEVEDLRQMLGGISRKLAYNLAYATDFGILVSRNGQTVEQCLNRPGPRMEMR